MVIKTIEQNESPKTDLHKNGQLMFQILRKAKLNCKSNSVEEGQPFQKKWKSDIYMQKDKSNLTYTVFTKINSIWIIILIVKSKTIKLLGETIEENFMTWT